MKPSVSLALIAAFAASPLAVASAKSPVVPVVRSAQISGVAAERLQARAGARCISYRSRAACKAAPYRG